jgi:hypothetical protein
MEKFNPFLWFNDKAEDAAKFYTSIFKNSKILNVLRYGAAPIDRLGELTWLGPASVVLFGLILGLVAHAFNLQNFDRWMLLLIMGTFTGAYPLMYFAQEFIPLNAAMFISSGLVLAVIAVRAATIIGLRMTLFCVLAPAAMSLALTLLAAVHTRLQGIIITGTGMALFIVTMLLMPRIRFERLHLPSAGAIGTAALACQHQ